METLGGREISRADYLSLLRTTLAGRLAPRDERGKWT
jgi:hypothetical protein